jgi:hypothetical protein
MRHILSVHCAAAADPSVVVAPVVAVIIVVVGYVCMYIACARWQGQLW